MRRDACALRGDAQGTHPERVFDGQHRAVHKELLHSLRTSETAEHMRAEASGERRCTGGGARTSNAFSNWSNGAGVQPSYASSEACSLYAPGTP